jgi:hypothetical protein
MGLFDKFKGLVGDTLSGIAGDNLAAARKAKKKKYETSSTQR